MFTDRGDGTYTYQFNRNITTVAGVPYDATLTHRVALQTAGLPVDSNAAYDWQPSSGATTGLFSREIVDDDTCNACHDRLQFHGGGRRDVKYCVTCHNPGSTDAESQNTVDMTVMIHKIHAGANLPSVGAGGSYFIVGFGNSVHDYSGVHWTKELNSCQSCHDESDANTPQAGNWKTAVNTYNCTSCHDNVDFVTGANHLAGPASDAQCDTCHGPAATVYNGDLRVANAHVVNNVEAARAFELSVTGVQGFLDAAGTMPGAVAGRVSPGEYAKVTIRVRNPLTGTDYDLLSTDPNAPFTNKPAPLGSPSLSALVAWPNTDHSNFGTLTTPASGNPGRGLSIDFRTAGVVANGDGTFSKMAPLPVPTSAISGSGTAYLRARPYADIDPSPTVTTWLRFPVPSAGRPFAITDTAATARRNIVDMNNCYDCHQDMPPHGQGYLPTNASGFVCAECHAPDAVCDIGAATEGTMDGKLFMHTVHNGNHNFCGNDLTGIVYPGALNNCEGCHRPNTFYPVDPTRVLAVSVRAGADRSTPVDDFNMSPNKAVCSSCHTTALALEHMKQNGSSFDEGTGTGAVVQTVAGVTTSGNIETCTLCHGPGRSADLRVMHNIASFKFNR